MDSDEHGRAAMEAIRATKDLGKEAESELKAAIAILCNCLKLSALEKLGM